MPLTPFLTATGFLAAILLVWGQLWISAYPVESRPETVYLGLIWTYLAVFVALLAFAWGGWSYLRMHCKQDFQVRGLPIGLLVAVLLMTGINVGQSIVSTVTKVLGGIPLDQPLIQLATSAARVGAIAFIFGVAAFTIGMSLCGTRKRWVWVVEVAILGTVLLVLYLLVIKTTLFYPHIILTPRS